VGAASAVGASTGASAATGSVVCTVPSSLPVGTLLIASVGGQSSSGTSVINVPTGWTRIGTQASDSGSVNGNMHASMMYHVVAGGDPTTVTFTSTTANLVVRMQGYNAVLPVVASNKDTSTPNGTVRTASPVTTTGPDQIVVASFSNYFGSATNSWTAGSGWTSRGTQYQADIAGMILEDRVVATASTVTPTATGTDASTCVCVLSVALDGPPSIVTVASTRATTWKTLTTIGEALSTQWATIGLIPVPTSRATTWRTSAVLTEAQATSWTVRTTVAPSTRTSTWRALKAVAASRATTYRVMKQIQVFKPTEWGVDRSGSATNTPGLRLRVYAPNGTDLGPLPAIQEAQAAYPLDDVGALSFSYSPLGPRAALLGQPCEIAVEISPDRGVTWIEPRDSRFVYLADGRDPTDVTDNLKASAKSYVWRLSKAVIYPAGDPRPDG
jgi:hypothetical protein